MSGGKSVALVACGSFNPPTFMHLRMFEDAREHLQRRLGVRVVAGLMSPASDHYAKAQLAPAAHRLAMCRAAAESSDWIQVDSWEAEQGEWQRSLRSLEHAAETLRERFPELEPYEPPQSSSLPSGRPAEKRARRQGSARGPRTMLLVGGDLLASFAVAGLWRAEDVEAIVSDFGLVVLPRAGSDSRAFVQASDLLSKYQANIHTVEATVSNDVSSTAVRRALRRGESVKYLVPDPIIRYVHQHGLYVHDQAPPINSDTKGLGTAAKKPEAEKEDP